MPTSSTRQEKVALAALVLTLVFILVDQAYDPSFQKGHRGWCSANVMGIIEHATPSNGLVGYTLEYLQPNGKHDFIYFDRYPVFFSATMHVVLNTFDLSRGMQLHVARQAMNVLHVFTLLFGVALLVELELSLGIAVAAVALAASGTLMVSYRDMIHFDQAALLGFVVLLWAIARWSRTKNDRLIYFATAFAVLSGRGYASFAVLGTWWIVETVSALLTDFRSAPKRVAFGVQTRACVLGIALAGTCLGYNVWMESQKRDVPLTEVGIVRSAIKRLTLDASFNQAKAHRLAWKPFAALQLTRELRNLRPFVMADTTPKGTWPLLAAALATLMLALFIATRRAELRTPLIVAALAGLAWIFPMRGLTAFHEFTTMFLLSLNIVLIAALLSRIPARMQLLPALLACACLIASTHERNDELRKRASAGQAYTDDLVRIDAKLQPGDPIRVNHRKLVPGVPYALGFLLPYQPIVQKGRSRFSVTARKDEKHLGKNLTPRNKRVFLYDAGAQSSAARSKADSR